MSFYSDSRELPQNYDLAGEIHNDDKFVFGNDGNKYVMHGVRKLTNEQANDSQFLAGCAARGLRSLIANELKRNKNVADGHNIYSAVFGNLTSNYKEQKTLENFANAA
jgi:hypothetical protein